MPTRRASGCLVGLAIGDAMGAPTEFLNMDEILQRFPPHGPQELSGDPAPVTDDTQMTLAVAEALGELQGLLTAESLEMSLRRTFVRWWQSPENNRAPGMSCLQACERLSQGVPWREATVAAAKGCGANMRVAPVALFAARTGVSNGVRAGIAQFQAALTHGHPTALAASDLTATVVSELIHGADPAALPARLRDYCRSQREVYHAEWLGGLWERPGVISPEQFMARGWDECLAVLDRVEAALPGGIHQTDPCQATGAGWVAEEALATGLFCFLLSPDDPMAAVRRAAFSSGDSDSIASLAGAFAGAYVGLAGWPGAWVDQLEYREQLLTFGALWD